LTLVPPKVPQIVPNAVSEPGLGIGPKQLRTWYSGEDWRAREVGSSQLVLDDDLMQRLDDALSAPPRDLLAVEDLLTDGYARALQMEARIAAISEEVDALVHGRPDAVGDLRLWRRDQRELTRDLVALRAQLARVQDVVDAARSGRSLDGP